MVRFVEHVILSLENTFCKMASVRSAKTFTESHRISDPVILSNVHLVKLLIKMEHVRNALHGQEHKTIK